MKYYIIVFALFFSGHLLAQDTQAEIEQFLVKEWTHTSLSSSVGQSINGKCEAGQFYHFQINGILEIQSCIRQRMRTHTQKWSLEKSEYGDWLLQLESGSYTLEMKSKHGKETLILIPELAEDEAEDQRSKIKLFRLEPLPESNDPIEE